LPNTIAIHIYAYLGLVPAITDGTFTLGESAAILQYIAETRNLTSWYPTASDPISRAKVNFWLHWHHGNSRKATKGILIHRLFRSAGADEKLATGVKGLSSSLQFMEKQLGGADGKALNYLTGDSPTIADLLIVTELDQLMPSAFNLFDFTKFPNILNWISRIQKLPNYDKIFSGVEEVSKKYK
jgi:glutathione S-transferase